MDMSIAAHKQRSSWLRIAQQTVTMCTGETEVPMIRPSFATVPFVFLVSYVSADELPRAEVVRAPTFEQRRQLHATSLVKEAHRLTESLDDAIFLEGTLSLLAANENDPRLEVPVFDVLNLLAQRRWRAPLMESATERWDRLQIELGHALGDQYNSYRDRIAKHELQFGRPCPLEWRAKRESWKEFVNSLLFSTTVREPADVWRKRIADDEEHAMFYRQAYAAAASAAGSKLDNELLKPLIDPVESRGHGELRRVAEALEIATLAKHPENDATRSRLRKRLETLITVATFDDLLALVRVDALGGAYQPVLRGVLVRALSPALFDRFAALADIPPLERRRYYLHKEFHADFRRVPLADVLTKLQTDVSLPVWIDSAARADRTPITLEANGPWLNVLESVLAQSTLRFVVMHDELYWIGSPADEKNARSIWEHSLARTAAMDQRFAARLREAAVTNLQDSSLHAVAEAWRDLHRVQLTFRSHELAMKTVTADLRGIPLHLALELVARQEKFDWSTLGNLIVCGSPAEIEAVRRKVSDGLRRRIDLAGRKGAVDARLSDATTLEFINTPLPDVCAYLSDLHGVPIIVAKGDSSRHPITLKLRFVDLGSALDILLFDLDLTWSSDGEAVYIGSRAEVEGFLKQMSDREKRRLKYSALVAEHLRKKIHAYFRDESLATAAPRLSEMIKLPVELASDNGELAKTTISGSLFGAPADLALDILCTQHGLSWEATEKGVRIQRRVR
jgi:hypothetical protein